MTIHIDGNLVGMLTAAFALATNLITWRLKPRAAAVRVVRPVRIKRRLT